MVRASFANCRNMLPRRRPPRETSAARSGTGIWRAQEREQGNPWFPRISTGTREPHPSLPYVSTIYYVFVYIYMYRYEPVDGREMIGPRPLFARVPASFQSSTRASAIFELPFATTAACKVRRLPGNLLRTTCCCEVDQPKVRRGFTCLKSRQLQSWRNTEF